MSYKSNLQRNSNIEILRIVSMIMIISHHFVLYGVQQSYNVDIASKIYSSGSTINKLFASLLLPGGVVGVAIFFLIAGYFGINSNKIRLNKIIIPVISYSVLGLIIYLLIHFIIGYGSFNKNLLKNCLSSIFPIGNDIYWFATAYVLLMFMKPTINSLIHSMKSIYFLIIIIFLFCEYLIARQMMSPILSIIEGSFFYCIGAFMNIINNKFSGLKQWRYFLIFLIGWIGYVLFTHIHISGFEAIGICIFGTMSAIGAFQWCVQLKINNNGKINALAVLTFDVYLLHEFPLLREFIWKNLFRVDALYNNKLFPIISIIFILVLYLILTMIAKLLHIIAIDSLIDKWNSFKQRMVV